MSGDRLAGVLRLQRHDLVGARLDRVREAEEGPLTLSRCRVPPGLERLARRGVGAVETSSGVEIGARAKTSPVEGSTRSLVRPSAAAT